MYFNHSNNIFEYIYMILIIITEYTVVFPGSSAYRESAYNAERPCFNSWVRKIHWRMDRLPMPIFLGFLSGSDNKESTCNAGDLSWEDNLTKGMATHSNILAWRVPMDRGAWQATVHAIAKSQTQLSNFQFHFHNCFRISCIVKLLTRRILSN